jgi:D-alanyl-D-alanine carboxypeptidase
LLSLAAVVCVTALSSDDADARRRRASSSYNPPYAAIVVDANSGAVLHATNPDALRHPASLTKIMTLYLLFERLESGKLKLDSPLKVSSHAEDQAPTKLGLEEDQTIKAEDAIKGIITRSANDAAVVVAEALAGSEEEFAKLMTRKARALGMTKTVYKNASGLPDDDQVTTARDQAILGRAIQERFPTYYKYFQTRSFVFRGQTIGNHNRLLGRVEGVDGIKTGFIRASGFNLVTSVHRDKRYVVAVVLGGSSASTRDARMRQLLNANLASASTKRTAPMIAEAAPKAEPKSAQRTASVAGAQKDAQRFSLASASAAAAELDEPPAAAAAVPGSTDPIRPVLVKTLNVKPSGVQTASAAPLPFAGLPRAAEPVRADPAQAAETAEPPPAPATAATPPPAPVGAGPGVLGTLTVRVAAAPAIEPAPTTTPAAPTTATPTVTATPVAATTTASAPVAAVAKQPVRTGWIIQVGAYPDEDTAKQRLSTAMEKASRLLAKADPFTEPTLKDGTTYYRARFAGLNKDQAEAACKFLKRNDVDCMAIKN